MIMLYDPLHMRDLVRPGEAKPAIILGGSALLLAVHRHFGSIEFWARTAAGENLLAPPLLMFLGAFLLMGVVPFLVITRVFHDHPRDFGLRVGNWREGLRLTAIFLPAIALLLLFPASGTAEMRTFYPFSHTAASSVAGFVALEVPRIVLFYVAWEFFFRGFMLFGLRPYVGDWLAIWVQVIPSCLWHIGMPNGELISSIAGGLLFGIIALRTGSILWPLVLHASIGVLLDLFIILRAI